MEIYSEELTNVNFAESRMSNHTYVFQRCKYAGPTWASNRCNINDATRRGCIDVEIIDSEELTAGVKL